MFHLKSAKLTWRRRFVLLPALLTATACGAPTEPKRSFTWTSLAADMWYTCGLRAEGEAFCWGGVGGYRFPLPLEDSLSPNSALPLRVPGGHSVVESTVGEVTICALDSSRAAFCWGPNQLGSVGDGSYLAKRGPSAVLGGHQWKSIDAGSSRMCGITTDDQAFCWGNQFRGALGDGKLFGSNPEPDAVIGGMSFTAIAVGLATVCAIATGGETYCWGVNDYGMLGDGQPPEPFKEQATPSRVVGGHRFVALAVGGYHVCGLTQDARAYCWGWNQYGELGNGTTSHSSVPVLVDGDHRWTSLVAGGVHTCGLTTDGTLYCWGNNVRGQFGNGTQEDSHVPLLIAEPGTYVEIATGGNHTCGLTSAGAAFCWGQGDYGQLGDGVIGDRLVPTRVADRE